MIIKLGRKEYKEMLEIANDDGHNHRYGRLGQYVAFIKKKKYNGRMSPLFIECLGGLDTAVNWEYLEENCS